MCLQWVSAIKRNKSIWFLYYFLWNTLQMKTADLNFTDALSRTLCEIYPVLLNAKFVPHFFSIYKTGFDHPGKCSHRISHAFPNFLTVGFHLPQLASGCCFCFHSYNFSIFLNLGEINYLFHGLLFLRDYS